ncbi:hypothetical protein [Virgibacillus ihumii]|uniref:hypothetical protein n=1 Tax=Virgibacillus ihumii TaxID=2686091 RepID=UPI00157CB181|nr:hypothetical protein [Virgibacillus ihumii]
MGTETASDWLKDKGLSNADIDFVETILTFTSTTKEQKNKLVEINKTLQTSFPDKKAEIDPNLTLSQFDKILRDNGIAIDVIEMLTRYKEQGLCTNLCNRLLEGQLYH